MTNPYNVDICVTCVSEKPPKLPLREELPSLGIEVIYNAHGVGAKATKQEQKRKLKQYQSDKLKNSNGLFAKLKHRFGNEDDKRREAELLIPHALSYSSYQRRLDYQFGGTKKNKEEYEGSEVSSYESSEDHLQDSQSAMTPSVDDMKPPIKSLEIPTHSAEDLAIQEAFNVFADNPINFGEQKQPGRDVLFSTQSNNSAANVAPPESRQPSHNTGLTTMSSLSNQGQQIRVAAETQSMKESLAGLHETPTDQQLEDYNLPSVQSLEDMAAAYLSKYISPATIESPRTEESHCSDVGDSQQDQ